MSKNPKDEEIDDSLKIVARTSVFVFIILLLSKVLFYFYRIVIARNFGPAMYGTFSLASIIFSLTIALSSFGFFEGLTRFIPLYRGTKEINNVKYIFRFSIFILTLSSLFFGVILFFSSEFVSINIFHEPNLIIFLKILAVALPFFVMSSVFLYLIKGFEKIKMHSFLSEFFQTLVKLISILLLIFFGTKSNAVPLSYFFGVLFLFLVAYFYCRYKLPQVFERYILKKEAKRQIRKKPTRNGTDLKTNPRLNRSLKSSKTKSHLSSP